MKKSVQDLPFVPDDFDLKDYAFLFHDSNGVARSSKLSNYATVLSGKPKFLDKRQSFPLLVSDDSGNNDIYHNGKNFAVDLSEHVPPYAKVAFCNFYYSHDGTGGSWIKIYSDATYTDGYFAKVSATGDKWKSRKHRFGINVEVPIINQHIYVWVRSHDSYYDHNNNVAVFLHAWM